ncbi:UNKNOWN [Stylonychia lemnae]|uniref:Uncharacterized protein n=1 Tax=Stylonychia lemnae TaxID=5949 RepID=A0A078A0W1_STYLE|nr:UNKNOWN [Stylonychia lemnae]|eukprot:CDW74429.1 UNKNOWN [Stylonychia lemnae]
MPNGLGFGSQPLSSRMTPQQDYYQYIGIDHQELLEKYGIPQLNEIQPDTWKNIPFPIVTAIKSLVRCELLNFNRVTENDKSVYELQCEINNQLKQLEKMIKKVEQNGNQASETIRNQISNNFSGVKNELEQAANRTALMVKQLHEEIKKFDSENEQNDDHLKSWVAQYFELRKQDLVSYIDAGDLRLTKQIRDFADNGFKDSKDFDQLQKMLTNKFGTYDKYVEEMKNNTDKMISEFNIIKDSIDAQFETSLPNRFKQLGDRFNKLYEAVNQLEKVKFPELANLVNEFSIEYEKTRIETKVKQGFIDDTLKQLMNDLDKLTAKFGYIQEDFELKRRESIVYTQDNIKQLKDTYNRLLENQKNDVADKVRSLNFLIDKGGKRMNQNYEQLKAKIEELTGQKFELPALSERTPYNDSIMEQKSNKDNRDSRFKRQEQTSQFEKDQNSSIRNDDYENLEENNLEGQEKPDRQNSEEEEDNQWKKDFERKLSKRGSMDDAKREDNKIKMQLDNSQEEKDKLENIDQEKIKAGVKFQDTENKYKTMPTFNQRKILGDKSKTQKINAVDQPVVKDQLIYQRVDNIQIVVAEILKTLQLTAQQVMAENTQNLDRLELLSQNYKVDEQKSRQLFDTMKYQQEIKEKTQAIHLKLSNFDSYFKKLISYERNRDVSPQAGATDTTPRSSNIAASNFGGGLMSSPFKEPKQSEDNTSKTIDLPTPASKKHLKVNKTKQQNKSISPRNQQSDQSRNQNESLTTRNQEEVSTFEFNYGNADPVKSTVTIRAPSQMKIDIKKRQKVQFRTINNQSQDAPITTRISANDVLSSILEDQSRQNLDSKMTIHMDPIMTFNKHSSRNFNEMMDGKKKKASRTSSQDQNRSELDRLPPLINHIDITRTENQLFQNQELKVQRLQKTRDQQLSVQNISLIQPKPQPLEVKYQGLTDLNKKSPRRQKTYIGL